MLDPISDLLTRLRNAKAAKKSAVTAPYSKFKEAVLNVMLKEGFIDKVEIKSDSGHKDLVIYLENSQISHIKRISKPGQRRYVAKKFLPKPLRGMGLVIVSTPKGVLSGREAAKLNLGGELICEVW